MTEESQVLARIRAALAGCEEDMLAFARDLVAVPTENPPGGHYRECVDVIATRLAAIGLEPTVLAVPPEPTDSPYPRYVVQSFYGTGRRTLYFHGHYDVVPAADAGQFAPHVADGVLWGRGAADMKGGLAAMIYAVKALRDSGVSLDGRIGLTIVPDEETGGAGGSQYLARRGLLGADGIGMLTPEPTTGTIWNANRGAITLRVTVKGRPAHVGLQHEGVNAFEGMLDVANALRALKAEVETRTTAFHVVPEEARRSILMLGGRCEGGTSFNLVPAECWFTVERRINPEEDLAAEKERLFALFARLREQGTDLAVEVLQEGKSSGVAEDNPVGQALAGAVEAVRGARPPFVMCPGLLEIRFYAERGIPAFAYSPALLEVSHGPREHVPLADLTACAAVYALSAVRLLAA